MSGLPEFFAARLDEDEAAAREAASIAPWSVSDTNDDGTRNVEPAEAPDGLWHGNVAEHIAGADARHIARHDPGRVLREVEAKRAILAAYVSQRAAQFHDPAVVDELRDVVQTLASVHSGHPGYRPEWNG
jgi:Family of unknown function (DUF6221)